MTNLAGKIAVVTGASRGIGQAIAIRLAKDGALVAAVYANPARPPNTTLDAITSAGGQGFALQGDIGQVQTIDDMYQRLDEELLTRTGATGFDILVNNAGINANAAVADTDEATFDRLFAVNTKGTFFVTQKAIPRLRDGGRIINLTTAMTRFVFPGYAAYSATKGAVQVLTHFLAAELGARGITVNDIAPGAIDTDINAGWLRDNPIAQEQLSQSAALGRVGQVEDVAGVAAMLASDDGRWITGQHIEASGGARL
ncbi:SDR family oxidoreductase [Methylobacterium brachiatum]